jgi:hypothetical protein
MVRVETKDVGIEVKDKFDKTYNFRRTFQDRNEDYIKQELKIR